jgi:hypothetical protein
MRWVPVIMLDRFMSTVDLRSPEGPARAERPSARANSTQNGFLDLYPGLGRQTLLPDPTVKT